MTETVELQTPVEFGDEVISELTLNEPTLADLKKMDRETGEVGKLVVLIASLSGQPPSAIERIRASDLEAITDVLGKYMPVAQKTGTS